VPLGLIYSIRVMLNKSNRLTKDKEFDNVFNPRFGRKKTSFDKIIGIKMVPNQINHSRFGILISVKVSKKAVIRNKIKRQIRDIISMQLDKIKQEYDCVIICLPEIAGKEHKEIEKSLIGHFKRIGIYK